MKKLLKTLATITTGYILGQQIWVFWNIFKNDPNKTLLERANKAADGVAIKETKRRKARQVAYTVTHVIENGIERISCLPTERKHKTPLLFQHGMFHDAWGWHLWHGSPNWAGKTTPSACPDTATRPRNVRFSFVRSITT